MCIRTGARPGAEFAKLAAKHIKDKGDRMEWVFQVHENKTGKQTRRPRIIRITDSETIKIVREQIAKYPQGPIFRNTRGTAWLRKNLELSFRKAKVKLQKDGIELDIDACMYSCRHTYAKRVLQGYWTGKQTNIETLLGSWAIPRKCAETITCNGRESYEEPLWECARLTYPSGSRSLPGSLQPFAAAALASWQVLFAPARLNSLIRSRRATPA